MQCVYGKERKIICVSPCSSALISCKWNGNSGGFSLNETHSDRARPGVCVATKYGLAGLKNKTWKTSEGAQKKTPNCRMIITFSVSDDLFAWLTDPLL